MVAAVEEPCYYTRASYPGSGSEMGGMALPSVATALEKERRLHHKGRATKHRACQQQQRGSRLRP